MIRLAERLGITSPLHDEASLALGSSEVRLIELTAAYATVANGGYLVWPEGIESIAGGDGDALYQRRPVDEPVLEPGVVRAMTAMLETTLDRGTGREASLRRFVAGKTGTSSEYRDAWFVGFTDSLVVGVWVGNDDGPMPRVTGGSLPARIFREFILRGQGDLPFRPPRAGQAARGAGDRRDRRRARYGALDQGPVRLGTRRRAPACTVGWLGRLARSTTTDRPRAHENGPGYRQACWGLASSLCAAGT